MPVSRRSLLLASTAMLGRRAAPGATPGFEPSPDGSFRFDTGALKGTFRKEGRSVGLIPVTHIPSGVSLASSMGLFGVYRTFGNGRRYGTGMWYVPSEVSTDAKGAVTEMWPAALERPFTMNARYRWAAPNILDVSIEVTAVEDLSGFETFLASYFGPSFTSAKVLVKGGTLMPAEHANGKWQIFPRDPAALKLIYDGRWKFPPNPVEWAKMPDFELPISIRTDPAAGWSVVIMAPAPDCFAIATPEESDQHHSTYLSLFGLDLKKGAAARARARLIVLPPPDPDQLRGLYSKWIAGKE
ncbi:MAG: hypothetical protein IT166_07440 [Bryobacterales bacterium]|nr:hypothetical protein [Bryobacterales bacterium]